MIEIGIVGKPNVGKSTLFSALTMHEVPIANYPFTTIDANIGVGFVRVDCVCHEFGVKDNPRNSCCIEGKRFIPVKVIDTAGLVPDAWRGRGLGNQFLNKISMSDVIIHVIDLAGSTDIEGKPAPPGSHDPLEDIHFLERELVMWLYKILEDNWHSLEKSYFHRKIELSQALYSIYSGVKIDIQHIESALEKLDLKNKKPSSWTREDKINLAKYILINSKPILLAGNKLDIPISEKNLDRIKDAGYNIIPISALAELTLRKLANDGVIRYIPGDSNFKVINSNAITDRMEKGLTIISRLMQKFNGTGVQSLINYAVFKILDMIVVYPVRDPNKLTDRDGNVLPDAYLVKRGTTLKEFAGIIHSDLAKNILYGIDVRRKVRIKSDYVLRNNDVISIVTVK
ncbi:MAG TPA: redox-regulated ATPase YchF [Thermoprotei archaeon]|nr:redox-regulated ATPase YchF [Thermoprotei archaeon]